MIDYIDLRILNAVRKKLQTTGITLNDRHEISKKLHVHLDEIDEVIAFVCKSSNPTYELHPMLGHLKTKGSNTMKRYFTSLHSEPMTRDEIIKAKLGASYGWDEETGELQYIGNPLAFWQTQREADAVKEVLETYI